MKSVLWPVLNAAEEALTCLCVEGADLQLIRNLEARQDRLDHRIEVVEDRTDAVKLLRQEVEALEESFRAWRNALLMVVPAVAGTLLTLLVTHAL